MRLLCNFMVVLVHACPFMYYAQSLDYWVMIFLTCYLGQLLLPTLFLVSGWLCFRSYSMTDYGRRIKNRVRRLLVPFVCWNVLYVVLFSAISLVNARAGGQLAKHNILSLCGMSMAVLPLPWGAPLDSPTWFMRDLFFLFLMSPLLWLIYRKIGQIAAWFVILLPIAVTLCFRTSFLWFRPYAFSAFCLGGLLAFKRADLVVFCRERRTWLIPMSGLAMVVAFLLRYFCLANTTASGVGEKDVCYFLAAPLLICFADEIHALTHGDFVNKWLAPTGFFVYCSHIIIVSILMHALKGRLPCTLTSLIITLGTLAVVVSWYHVWKRLSPGSLKWFDGTL